jgi:hypothetical protein
MGQNGPDKDRSEGKMSLVRPEKAQEEIQQTFEHTWQELHSWREKHPEPVLMR